MIIDKTIIFLKDPGNLSIELKSFKDLLLASEIEC